MPLTVLDTRGDYCPLPLLKLRRDAAQLAPGDTLEIWSTDPLAPLDFEAWCLREGHTYTEAVATEAHQVCQIVISDPGCGVR